MVVTVETSPGVNPDTDKEDKSDNTIEYDQEGRVEVQLKALAKINTLSHQHFLRS